MPWIQTVDESDAREPLKQAYENIKGTRGKVANIIKIQSLNPRSMTNHMDLYLTLMFGPSGLKRDERELIAVVVSASNDCQYCVNHHAEALNHYWKNMEKIKNVIRDFRSIDLSERLRTMLEYVVKLTKTPNTMNHDDIATLRTCGFSDEDILNINLIASYFNFVNRTALGLGVEFNADEMRGYKY
jgi:uncharacterized peroxidase-related enzyme